MPGRADIVLPVGFFHKCVCPSFRVKVRWGAGRQISSHRWTVERGGWGEGVSVAKLSAVNCHPCDPLFLFYFTWFTGFTTVTFRNDRPASTYKQSARQQTCRWLRVENAQRQKSFQHIWTGVILWLRGRERFTTRVNILLVLLCLSFAVTRVPNTPLRLFFLKNGSKNLEKDW